MMTAGLRLNRRRCLRLRLVVGDRMVRHVMMTGGKKPPPFEVFNSELKYDATPGAITTDSIDDILDRHWPLLGKSVLRKPWLRNFLRASCHKHTASGGRRPPSR
jgi:hypothetical protein